MATEAQFAANRENAGLSTGPVTQEGREKVSQNAPQTQTEGSAYLPEPSDPTNAGSQTGLFTQRDFVRPSERQCYNGVVEDLLHEFAPDSIMEDIHFAEAVTAVWRLKRCANLEFRLVDEALENQFDPMADEKHARLQQAIDRARTQSHNLLAKASKELKRLKAERLARPQTPPAPHQIILEEMEIKAAEIRARRKTEQTQSAPPEPEYESMPSYGHARGFPGAASDSVETTPSAAPGSPTCAFEFERADPMDWEIDAILASMRKLRAGDLVAETGQGHTVARGRQSQSETAEGRYTAEQLAETAATASKITEQSQFVPTPLPVASKKVGRNAACPCNSGKKYKRCCGIGRPEAMKTAA